MQLKTTTLLMIVLPVMFVYGYLLPPVLWNVIMFTGTSCFIAAAFPQIKLNYDRRATGQLSAVMVSLEFCGGLLRLWTAIVDLHANIPYTIAVCVGITSAATMLIQLWMYRKLPYFQQFHPDSKKRLTVDLSVPGYGFGDKSHAIKLQELNPLPPPNSPEKVVNKLEVVTTTTTTTPTQ